MAVFNIRSAMDSAVATIKVLARIAAAVVETSGRPTDAVAPEGLQPVFLIHPNHLDGWRGRVDEEIWRRLSIFPKPMVLTDDEAAIQRGNYALGREQLRLFRAGVPVLMFTPFVKIRARLGKGGRKKDDSEVHLRNALAIEVYRRDTELCAIEALEAKKNGRDVDPTKISALGVFAEGAWVDGVPTRGRAAGDGNPETDDEKHAFFESLREEGRKTAMERVAGAARPQEIRDAIIDEVYSRAPAFRTPADFETARSHAVGPVKLIMRACAHATAVTETKHAYSKRQRAVLEKVDRRRKHTFDPCEKEMMTKREHGLIVDNAFSAVELAEIAFLADIDPNLLCPTQILAWPEFAIARKIGRLGRGKDVVFKAHETQLLCHLIFAPEERQPQSLYPEVRTLLAELALHAMPIEAWKVHFANAIDIVIDAPPQADR